MTQKGLFSSVCTFLLLLGSVAAPSAVHAAASVEGTWRTLTGTEITVQPCGTDFCGTFSYIVVPAKDAAVCKGMAKDDFATLMLDYQNPNKALQTRNLLGLKAVSIESTGDPDEYSANIYNAEEGKTYNVRLWIRANTLTLGAGCFGGICAVKQDWPRVPAREVVPDFTCDGGI